jgi:hypothetical protein
VASSGANLAPGATGSGSPAILNTGSLTLASGSNFSVDLHGAVAGTSDDQVNVTGTVTITGSNLVLNSVSGLTAGEHLFIAEKDGSDAVTGTFSGLANGAMFTQDRVTLTINYDGSGQSAGSDIELTVDSVPVPERAHGWPVRSPARRLFSRKDGASRNCRARRCRGRLSSAASLLIRA